MTVQERLLKYVTIMTPSDEESNTNPSSKCQFDLGNVLLRELKELGVKDAVLNDKCYLYAKIPASKGCETSPAIGLIAHMDTVSDFTEHQIKPIVHENYDGEDLLLGDSGRKLENSMMPHLKQLKGRTLITTDGTTVLGADDKAGVAEIMTFVEYVMEHEEYEHGMICIGFTPDEEIGAGADHFDVAYFGADFAYTMDGGPEDEIEYENFNAAGAKFYITGVNVHPGSAKGVMRNAAAIACEIQCLLPKEQTPENTEGYEGFFHLTKMEGSVEKACLSYIIRDHDSQKFEQKKALLQKIEKQMKEKYGEDAVELTITDQYQNMSEKIKLCFHLIENAKKAVKLSGIEPKVVPIRGGTDGARLSFMGLPCPNLGTGGYGYHGPYEHITVEGMEIAVQTLISLISMYVQ